MHVDAFVTDISTLSSPVRCEFRLFVPMSPMQGLARQQTINPHIIHVFDIFVDLGDRASCSRPLKVTLAFPSPSQCAESGGAARQTPTMRRRLTVNLQKEDERRSLSGAVYSGRQDVFDCKPSRPTIFPHVETLQGPETTRGCYLRCDLPVFWDDLHLLVRMDALERGDRVKWPMSESSLILSRRIALFYNFNCLYREGRSRSLGAADGCSRLDC